MGTTGKGKNVYHRQRAEGVRWQLEKEVWVTETMNPSNKKKKMGLGLGFGYKIKLGIYKYTLLYALPHNPHAVIYLTTLSLSDRLLLDR